LTCTKYLIQYLIKSIIAHLNQLKIENAYDKSFSDEIIESAFSEAKFPKTAKAYGDYRTDYKNFGVLYNQAKTATKRKILAQLKVRNDEDSTLAILGILDIVSQTEYNMIVKDLLSAHRMETIMDLPHKNISELFEHPKTAPEVRATLLEKLVALNNDKSRQIIKKLDVFCLSNLKFSDATDDSTCLTQHILHALKEQILG